MTRSFVRTLLLVPLSCAALYACADDTHPEDPPASEYEDVVYEGTVTDEALTPLVSGLEQGMPMDVPSKAPTLDAPAAGEVAKSPIPAFTWHIGATASLHAVPIDDAAAARRTTFFPQSPGRERRPASEKGSFLGPLAELFGPIRSAEAHGTPFTGTATWVVFSTSANPKLHRVFTSELAHTPSQAAWDTMIAAQAPITITLVGAIFEDNRLATDGGPYKGSSTTVTIAP
jgi:hypothetical protein